MRIQRLPRHFWFLLVAAILALTACEAMPAVPEWLATAVPIFEGSPTPADVAVATDAPDELTPAANPTATTTAAALSTAVPTATATATTAPTNTPLPSATPEPTAVPVRIRNGMADMLLVPATTFEMGAESARLLAECEQFTQSCEATWFAASEPTHSVSVDAFYLDATEVTNEAYSAFLNEIGDHQGACDAFDCLTLADSAIVANNGRYGSSPDRADHPVTGVTWYGAANYCSWRGARLPTEAEWERAAGWDVDAAAKALYPWGDTYVDTAANSCDARCAEQQAVQQLDDGAATTAAVGSYPDGRSPVGVLDMAGNVWEWVSDWYAVDYYASSPDENPAGPKTGDARVVRGGSWFDTANFSAVAVRFPAPPTESGSSIGFRCAADLGSGNLVAVPGTPVPPAIAELDASEPLEPGEIELNGTGEPGSEVEILDNGIVIGTAVVDDDGAWSLVAALDAANHEIGVRAAGTTAAASTISVAIAAAPTPTAIATPTMTPTTSATTTREPTATREPAATPASDASPTARPGVCTTVEPGIDLGDRYIVGSCEYLKLIARRLGIDYAALLYANPQITDPNLVKPGQVIFLPPRDGTAVPPAPSVTPPAAPPAPTSSPPTPGSGLNN